MIVSTPAQFLEAFRQLPPDPPPRPLRGVFMIEPDHFSVSSETTSDNVYMDTASQVDHERALAQHRELARVINACGVPVIRFPGNAHTPDDVFPNNVFATTPGRLVLGAMCHPLRQQETQRNDIRQFFTDLLGYAQHDLSQSPGAVCELTGSSVIDRRRNINYCGMSQRLNPAGVEAMHQAFGFALSWQFELQPDEYHLNVVMTILADRDMILCPSAFIDNEVPKAFAQAYPDRVIEISPEEKNGFAGNCLAVTSKDVIISTTGLQALSAASRRKLEDRGLQLHAVDFDEIEKAGGSVRCSIGEIY
ncbi:MAG: arginine deiminase-related protein [Gammaproteobacteria bacterium]|nr:arginine deiminase-related protein [Gammaproteobacteria bacterium]